MNFIITCQRNLEDKTIEETRKLLDGFGDSNAKISKTQFSGIIQLDTSLDIFDVIKKFRVIIDEEPWSVRFCSRIIPIQDLCQSDLKSIKENIKYRVVGGLKFYERREVKDALAYFKILVNPLDNLSLERILNL